jgi:NAD(P)-dependent dehydrogenase (short-subunit alcohol dehydrogenase family)
METVMSFANKTILVTGGSKGIGYACAERFSQEHARVVIVSRTQAHIDRAAAALPGVLGLTADLEDVTAAAAIVERIEGEVGPIDVLVNSAGAAKRSPPEELTPAVWRAAMEAKFFSTINVLDPVIKAMALRGRGVIVNVIGSGGKVAAPFHLAGGSANAALMLATAGLGNAYAASGVRVVGVSPGLTDTGRVSEGMAAEARLAGITVDEARSRSLLRLPMARMAMPEEIANVVLFLASDEASYVTGITINVDGGRYPVVV